MNDRRTFLKTLGAAVLAAGPSRRWRPARRAAGGPPAHGPGIRKSILINMLPRDLPYAQRFAMAREAGFDAIEMQT